MSPSKFAAGSYVWAKCGTHFWPAQVVDFDGLPADIKEDFPDKKKPQYVVKFFDEDGYEFLKNDKNLHPYNCDKKEEFIKKGIVKSRSQSKEGQANGWFAKFPQDVIRCEKLTGGDQKILDKEPFKETPSKAINYKEIFVDPEAANDKKSAAKRKSSSSAASANGSPKKKSKGDNTPSRPISHPRFKPGGEQHQVRIMQQPSTPYHLDLQKKEENKSNNANNYTCHICGFATSRLNVIMLHNKSHSEPSNGSTKAKGRTPTAAVSTPKSGKKKAEKASPAPVKSRAKPKSPKKAETPKAEKAANGRGSKRSVDKVEDTPKAAEKKPRMTKKKKEEMAKKEQEKKLQKKKILGDWDEEEDGEAEKEEKKKIKANIEGGDDSELSDAESDQEAYFQDDNIQGNVYGDEDDEELFQDPVPEPAKPTEPEVVEDKVENEEANTDDALACVAKVLEETKVPEIDTSGLVPLPEVVSSKKSVKFPEQVAKEIAITKMALVQPKSNMAGPMEVEDEFAEGDEDLEPKASTAKKILKKRSLSPPPPPRPQESDEDEEIEKVTSTEDPKEPEETESNPPEATENVASSEKSAAESMLELGATEASSEAKTEAAADGKDTYLMVIDDSNNQLDQLNDSQTFYIDSNSLANGDLSNAVLATADQPTNGQEAPAEASS